MKQSGFLLFMVLNLSLLPNCYSALLDVYVSKEIKDFENCPWDVRGPSLNITHNKDYESITACWRFLVTAFPHCAGISTNMVVVRNDHRDDWWDRTGGDLHDYRLYPPISGMSVNGKHAGWLGFQFNETEDGSWEQVPWRGVLYNDNLKLYEWQSVCTSYSKANKRKLLYHNGIKYLDTPLNEDPDNIIISKNFFSNVYLTASFRGSFTDFHVYSTPMDHEALVGWTICQYDTPGDVFQWDINRLNLTQDENIISEFVKEDSNAFCKDKTSSKKQIHIFGDNRFDPMSNVEGDIVCKRLNGKIKLLPATKEGLNQLADYFKSFGKKSNLTEVGGWMGGVSKLDSQDAHPYPDKGVYDFVDRETGQSLINEENRKFMKREIISYQILEDICMNCYTPSSNDDLNCAWQKCSRKQVGRVICEFTSTPAIRIKGLCSQAPIDKDFLLMEPKPNEGK